MILAKITDCHSLLTNRVVILRQNMNHTNTNGFTGKKITRRTKDTVTKSVKELCLKVSYYKKIYFTIERNEKSSLN